MKDTFVPWRVDGFTIRNPPLLHLSCRQFASCRSVGRVSVALEPAPDLALAADDNRVPLHVCVCVFCLSSRPAIVTEGNGIKIQSPGGVVFQTKGTVEFQDQQGNPVIPTGLKGEKVSKRVRLKVDSFYVVSYLQLSPL